MTDADSVTATRRPKKMYVVVEHKSRPGEDETGKRPLNVVDLHGPYVDRDRADEEKQEIADLYRDQPSWEDGGPWKMWKVAVRELFCDADLDDAEPVSEARLEMMQPKKTAGSAEERLTDYE